MTKPDRGRLTVHEPVASINLEAALVDDHPNEPLWDYGLGIRRDRGECAVWIEVHPAASGNNFAEMHRKLAWLKSWLEAEDQHPLRAMTESFYWIASGKVPYRAGTPQRRKIEQAGLRFAGEHLVL